MQICRTLGTAQLRNLDPFLMLDEMRLPASAAFQGFPNHPHRGEYHTVCVTQGWLLCVRRENGLHGHFGCSGKLLPTNLFLLPQKYLLSCLALIIKSWGGSCCTCLLL